MNNLPILRLLLVLIFAGCAESQTAAPAIATDQPSTPRPSSPSEPAPALHDQITDLLGRMTAAVSAADPQAYLACVSLTDPCFATEQRNWAKDLTRNAPEHFEATIGDSEPTLAPDGAALVKLRMSWRLPGGSDHSLTYPARFVRGETGWLYAGESWKIAGADRVTIFYEGDLGDAAKNVAEVLPGVRAHVHEGFGLESDTNLTQRTQEVKLYASMKHLQQSIYLSYRDALDGWNEPGESIKILSRDNTGKAMLQGLLAHEYGHVATFELGPTATDMPWWILEGVADLSAQSYTHDWPSVDRTVRRWAEKGELVEWSRLADFHGEATQHMVQVYYQGHHMVGYISDRFGREKRNDWLRAMANGASLDDATRKALGLAFTQLDHDWRQTLAPAPKAGEADSDK